MSNRILEVLEAVAVYGPATLDEITRKLPRTRSSVYRALKSLEQSGWVALSLNGRSYTISCRMEKLAELYLPMPEPFCAISESLRTEMRPKGVKLSIVLHVKGSEFTVLDSSAFPLPREIDDSDHIEVYLRAVAAVRLSGFFGFPQSVHQEQAGSEVLSMLEAFQTQGYFFCDLLEFGFIPIALETGELSFLVLEGGSFSTSGVLRSKKALSDIFARFIEDTPYSFKRREHLTGR